MQNDFIIVLAWPEGMVAAAGSWYDKVLAKDGKYRVGHSAMVLVDSNTKQMNYMDFGRYHTPLGFGRVRDLETDPELKLKTTASIEKGRITNIEEILLEIDSLQSTHGDGKLFASVLDNICFKKGYKYAKSISFKDSTIERANTTIEHCKDELKASICCNCNTNTIDKRKESKEYSNIFSNINLNPD